MALNNIWRKLREAFFSVMPITLVIFALIIFFVPTGTDSIIKLAISAVFMIFGIAFFSIGADNAMIELGSAVGATISKKNKILFMIVAGFVIGFAITIAEPDLMVLAKQVVNSTNLGSVWPFVIVVSVGVGVLFILGILRVVFNLKLSVLLTICYAVVFILSLFAPKEFVPIAFDSGSVTTGPTSVPFLISFGLGISAVRSKRSEDDSFGLIALCSVGPIISVMILSFFIDTTTVTAVTQATVYSSISQEIFAKLLGNLKDVAIILVPIVLMFVIFQIFSFKFPKTKVVRTFIGFFLTYLGISLFLTGVMCGYYPLGKEIGEFLAGKDFAWVAIPLGFVLGALAIIAEPALQVLKDQVAEITNNTIKKQVIVIMISLGVALAAMIDVVQTMLNINCLYILFPLYTISLILTFTNSKLFSAIAFDTGGVATGTMSVSFILPFLAGFSSTGSAFGTVAVIAVMPVFTMQILGLVYKIKLKNKTRFSAQLHNGKNCIVEFNFDKPIVIKPRQENRILEFNIKN
jgi:hypothetical protein